MKEQDINLTNLSTNQLTLNLSKVKNLQVSISFFTPGKFSNAYVSYPEEIVYETKGEEHRFSVKENKSLNKKERMNLYLPNDLTYDLKVNNVYGECTIRDGKFHHLTVEANNIYLENTKAKGSVFCNDFHPDSNITLKNSTIDLVDGSARTIDISGSTIKKLENNNSICEINIKNNTVIDKFYSSQYKTFPSAMGITNITDSTIKEIIYRMGSLVLTNCHIGNMKCSYGSVTISKSKFIIPNTIEIDENCRCFFYKEQDYIVKRDIFNHIKICDSKNKKGKTKVLLHEGMVNIENMEQAI